MGKTKGKAEYGDFQTPLALARDACRLLVHKGLRPASIVEPTCGKGSFLTAAAECFEDARELVGLDINEEYIQAAKAALPGNHPATSIRVDHGDFFATNWPRLFRNLPEPILVVGNPPWVTNTELGTLGSSNLPTKSNFQGHRGFDAVTGKSNFDISEWMLIHLLEALGGRRAALAMLCKTVVARKVLAHCWRNGLALESADAYLIDAATHFGASVDACFLVCETTASSNGHLDCHVHPRISEAAPSGTFGYRDGELVADIALYDRWRHLQGSGPYTWRSGVKHDCAKVMELCQVNGGYRNGLGEVVDAEDEYLFPMLKSSDLANGATDSPTRWMLVPQRAIGEDTTAIAKRCPRTWDYLVKHGDLLDARSSSIYRKRPRFSVFGIGPYTFAPWKVGISGFYKKLDFRTIGPLGPKPVVLDDTCYSLPCQTREEAECLQSLLNSDAAQEFFRAFVFWDAKRPITAELLRRLDLLALARESGRGEELRRHADINSNVSGSGAEARRANTANPALPFS